ncbi:hypothetical protein BDP55DRAFT_36229 [Colletotrichum godetiae]|uniref:Uncharacterized protein n=1 Tax=Colletotrichum godetiae TaxID=1209918 RepID=A0AAJ0EQ85_9PEZI|nr:uncharacterized protein BDP55DRAFT_36229 [Colletotrichum godetiae]KAK1657198.1 hypothetical protein BDP55DRAFT_36229 [Colletotrichum godetiae]
MSHFDVGTLSSALPLLHLVCTLRPPHSASLPYFFFLPFFPFFPSATLPFLSCTLFYGVGAPSIFLNVKHLRGRQGKGKKNKGPFYSYIPFSSPTPLVLLVRIHANFLHTVQSILKSAGVPSHVPSSTFLSLVISRALTSPGLRTLIPLGAVIASPTPSPCRSGSACGPAPPSPPRPACLPCLISVRSVAPTDLLSNSLPTSESTLRQKTQKTQHRNHTLQPRRTPCY